MCETKHPAAVVTAILFICLVVCVAPKPAHADPLDSTLYYLPHITGTPGDSHVVSLGINTVHDIGGFGFLFRFEAGMLTAEWLTYDGTRSEGIPIWLGDVVNEPPSAIRGLVIYDVGNYVPAGDGPVANIIIISSPSVPKGSLLPLTFFDESVPDLFPGQNELADPTGANVYLPDFNHGSILYGIDTTLPAPEPGDVNLNSIPYEITDFLLMLTQLQEGIDSYLDEEQQTIASDLNRDLLPWTISDLALMRNILEGQLIPPETVDVIDIIHLPQDSIWYTGFSEAPADTLEIPIYFSNDLPANAVSFKLDYSADEIQHVSHSTDGSRLPVEWDMVSVVERNVGLMFFAMPDASGSPQDFPLPPGNGLLVTLKFVVLNPPSTHIMFQFERLQSLGQANGYAVFQNDWWSFASFQQIDRNINLSFVYGDADGSGAIDIDDPVFLIMYLFSSGPAPEPYEAGDIDRNLIVDIDDVTALLRFIFIL